jgi:CBS domain-containing protein
MPKGRRTDATMELGCFRDDRLDVDQKSDGTGGLASENPKWRPAMKAKDVMTSPVVSIEPDASIWQAVRIMLQRHISGLPVIDQKGGLVGIVTEGDFLRRAETGTQRRRPNWLEFLMGPGRLADEYTRSHGRKIQDIMTAEPLTVTEDTPLDEVVRTMEERRVKRLPVVRGNEVVGIVTRANLVHALAGVARELMPTTASDEAIRTRLLTELAKEAWAPVALIDVIVRNGVVELWGTITEERQRQALVAAAENVPGVKAVHDHLGWVDPMSGMALYQPNEEPAQAEAF